MQQNEIKNTHSKLFGIRQLFRLEFKNRRQRNFGYSSRNFRRRRVPLVLILSLLFSCRQFYRHQPFQEFLSEFQ